MRTRKKDRIAVETRTRIPRDTLNGIRKVNMCLVSPPDYQPTGGLILIGKLPEYLRRFWAYVQKRNRRMHSQCSSFHQYGCQNPELHHLRHLWLGQLNQLFWAELHTWCVQQRAQNSALWAADLLDVAVYEGWQIYTSVIPKPKLEPKVQISVLFVVHPAMHADTKPGDDRQRLRWEARDLSDPLGHIDELGRRRRYVRC